VSQHGVPDEISQYVDPCQYEQLDLNLMNVVNTCHMINPLSSTKKCTSIHKTNIHVCSPYGFSGSVIAPTFHFNVDFLDFGAVGFGRHSPHLSFII